MTTYSERLEKINWSHCHISPWLFAN